MEKRISGQGSQLLRHMRWSAYKGKDVAVMGYTLSGRGGSQYLCEIARIVYYLPQYKIDSDRAEQLTAKSAALSMLAGEAACH